MYKTLNNGYLLIRLNIYSLKKIITNSAEII
jgi:hypothetical protein